jgi:hypothetical protein
MSPGPHRALEGAGAKYGTNEDDFEDPTLNPEDERLFDNARALEFGDWNYPVIEAHRASREDRLYGQPSVITAATNRNLLQPTNANKKRRKSQIKHIQESSGKGKNDSNTKNGESSQSKSRASIVGKLSRHKSSSSSSAKSDRSQLVDLVVEDHDAEEVERVRARKEGGSAWNEEPAKHFVHTYPAEGAEEEVREGFAPDAPEVHNPERDHNLDYPFTVEEESEEDLKKQGIKPPINEEAERWETRNLDDQPEEDDGDRTSPQYASFREERNVWNDEHRG